MTAGLALVTGANKGIGFEIAAGLIGHGMTVLVGSRDEERGAAAVRRLREAGGDVHQVPLEVTDDASVTAASDWVARRWDRLDVLVNNAGVAGVPGASLTTSDNTVEAVRRTLEVNVVGPFAVTKAFLPLLRRSPAGRIVNVSSEVGSVAVALDQDGPLWSMQGGGYGASKAALNRLTVSFAKELWDTPIKVNAVTPGFCATDLNGHRGHRSARQGAAVAIRLALIDADGPTGGFFGDEPQYLAENGMVPW